MEEIRLSFRLRDEEVNTWRKLRERRLGATDKFILDELLRRELIRLENRTTHSDMLVDIRNQLSGATMAEVKAILLRILSILEDTDYVP